MSQIAIDSAVDTSTTSVGQRLPGYEPDDCSALEPTLKTGQFRLNIFVPRLSRKEIRAFNKGATLIAIREGHLLYLAVRYGNLSAESAYSIYKDAPPIRHATMPRLEDIPEGYSPQVQCVLINSTTGIVAAVQMCAPPGFTRTWLAAIHEQQRTPYDENAEITWARELMSRYPTAESLANHPRAIVGKVGGTRR
jgi:hypothetical protein